MEYWNDLCMCLAILHAYNFIDALEGHRVGVAIVRHNNSFVHNFFPKMYFKMIFFCADRVFIKVQAHTIV